MTPPRPPLPAPAPAPADAAGSDEFAAFVVTRNGDQVDSAVTSLTIEDLPQGEVLIAVDWSAVNFKDAMVRRPNNRVARISPLVPGVDLVGRVVASSSPASGPPAPLPGSPVIVHGYELGIAHHGGFAEMARVPSSWVVPLPPGLSPRHAATIGTAGFTAALSLRRLERAGLVPGTGPVLVTGASGGVGSMAVALLAAGGYEVVASTGKEDEHGYLLELGAARVIGRNDLLAQDGRVLGPERWAGAVDCVGGPTLAAVLRTLRYGAAVAASGLTGGSDLASTVYPFIVRDASLLGIDSVQTPIAERRSVWEGMVTAYTTSVLDTMVADEIGLGGLDQALATIDRGKVRGRVLVKPGQ